MTKAYSSNLTQDQFELIEPLIPPAKPGGRPREVDMWDVGGDKRHLIRGCTRL